MASLLDSKSACGLMWRGASLAPTCTFQTVALHFIDAVTWPKELTVRQNSTVPVVQPSARVALQVLPIGIGAEDHGLIDKEAHLLAREPDHLHRGMPKDEVYC